MKTMSAAEIAAVAHQAGFRGDDLRTAVAVAFAESGGRPGVNAAGAEDSRGLWQINSAHFGRFDESRLYEPGYNARAAHDVWAESKSFRSDPWDAWSTYQNGLHRPYLDDARRGIAQWRAGHGGGHGGGHSGHGHGGGHGGDRGDIRPWQLPRRPYRHGGRRVRVDGAMMDALAGRLTGLLATVDTVHHRCRRERADLGTIDLPDGKLERRLRDRLDEALDDWAGLRRLPFLMTRDVGYVVEARRRFEDADRGEARHTIEGLIAALRRDHSRGTTRHVAALLRALYGPDRDSRVRHHLPMTPHRPHRPDRSPAPSGNGRPHAPERISLRRLADIAHRRFDLSVREYQPYDPVDPVHSSGSWHYQNRAFDASGSTQEMRRFADWVSDHYSSQLKELFWNGPGARNVKNGEHVGRWFVSGHTDHVHVAM